MKCQFGDLLDLETDTNCLNKILNISGHIFNCFSFSGGEKDMVTCESTGYTGTITTLWNVLKGNIQIKVILFRNIYSSAINMITNENTTRKPKWLRIRESLSKGVP